MVGARIYIYIYIGFDHLWRVWCLVNPLCIPGERGTTHILRSERNGAGSMDLEPLCPPMIVGGRNVSRLEAFNVKRDRIVAPREFEKGWIPFHYYYGGTS